MLAVTSLLLFGSLRAWCQRLPSASQETYVASTPCSPGTKPVPGIPANAPCELIKWKLVLAGKGETGAYSLDCYYGLPNQGSRDFINGGTRIRRSGKWVKQHGMPGNPLAVIYQFDPGSPQSISFLRLNNNLLHLLDSKQQLMTGTGAWSYTLNKILP